MPKYHRSNVTEIKTVNVPAAGSWSAPQSLDKFGRNGKLAYYSFRAPASSTITEVDVMVWVGGPDDDTTVTDPTTITEAYRVFYRTGIAVTGHATTADDAYALSPGKIYSLQELGGKVWFSVKGVTGTAQTGCQISFDAEDLD